MGASPPVAMRDSSADILCYDHRFSRFVHRLFQLFIATGLPDDGLAGSNTMGFSEIQLAEGGELWSLGLACSSKFTHCLEPVTLDGVGRAAGFVW